MSNHPLIPPPGYFIDAQGKLRKNPTSELKPEPKYVTVYNNKHQAELYRRLGYTVRHMEPDDTDGW